MTQKRCVSRSMRVKAEILNSNNNNNSNNYNNNNKFELGQI